MGLGNVFSGAWSDYKTNFWTNIKVLLAFYVLPTLVFLGIIIWAVVSSGLFSDIIGTARQLATIQSSALDVQSRLPEIGFQPSALVKQQMLVWDLIVKAMQIILLSLPLVLIAMFFYVYGYLAIYAPSLKKKGKYGFKEAVREAKPYYWRTVGLWIILSLAFSIIYLIGVILSIFTFGLGIIAAIAVIVWLGILWMFAPFIIVDLNKGVFESMGGSIKFVKGRWWKSLGYLLLVMVILGATYYIVILFAGIIGSLLFYSPSSVDYSSLVNRGDFANLSPEEQAAKINEISGNLIGDLIIVWFKIIILFSVIGSIYYLFTLPYGILYVKNTYQEFKKEKRK